jgi:hypothetical protein
MICHAELIINRYYEEYGREWSSSNESSAGIRSNTDIIKK